MNRLKRIGVVIVLTLMATPVFAGNHSCPYGTQECLDEMATKMKDAGWIGVELDVSAETGVCTVTKVVEDSPAEGAGIAVGDVLFAMNGIRLGAGEDAAALREARAGLKPGSSVTYTIKRNGTDREVTMTLAPMPADVLARYIGQHMLEHAARIQDDNSDTASRN